MNPSPLETPRLSLRPCVPAQLLLLIEEPERFAQHAGFAPAPGLREMWVSDEGVSDEISPEWLAALRLAQEPDPWRIGFFVIHRSAGAVIGTAGFKGPPDSNGTVEIAYGIAPSFQGQGYATEAAAALTAFAFAAPAVKRVRAHTLHQANASSRVLAKCGFRLSGTVMDPDDGLVWRWERGR